MIGGFLAKPVPRLLDPTWKLFVEFPYLLPALVCGLCGLISFLFGWAFIPEVRQIPTFPFRYGSTPKVPD